MASLSDFISMAGTLVHSSTSGSPLALQLATELRQSLRSSTPSPNRLAILPRQRPTRGRRLRIRATHRDAGPTDSLINFGELTDIDPNSSIGVGYPSPVDRIPSTSSTTASNVSIDKASVITALATQSPTSSSRSSFVDLERRKRARVPLHQLRQSGFVENSLKYRQIFGIRCYEVGAERTTPIGKIFSFFQEVALCHAHLLRVAGDGFGATHAMNRLGLIWVVTRMHVEVHRFPAWPEVLEIDSWIAAAGKNGTRRDWVMRCFQSGEVLARATSKWCMMHATTRRLAKFPDDVRAEVGPAFLNDQFATPQTKGAPRIAKLTTNSAQYLSSYLKPSHLDLDVNQHVSNLKYISWVLQSVPADHIETHDLTSITLEYRRECGSQAIVESLTSSKAELDQGTAACEFTHLLHTQGAQDEILRGRTTWKLKKNA